MIDLRYKEEFCNHNFITSLTSIGWDEEHINDFSLSNDKNIEFDFSSININHTHPLDNSVIIPQRVTDVFKSSKYYLVLCSLYRQEAILSKEIVNWLDMNQVDYRFFGSIPMLNPRIAPWAAKVFSKFDDNPKVMIYDTNLYLNKLRYDNGDMLFTDAAMKCDDRLVGELSAFYKS